MSSLISLLQMIVLVFELCLAVLVGYLLLLSAAALIGGRRERSARTRPGRTPITRFLILVPAHNEEKLLPDLLANLRQLDYPADLLAVHVVADNCADRTAEIARGRRHRP